jgi:hypothetical protein
VTDFEALLVTKFLKHFLADFTTGYHASFPNSAKDFFANQFAKKLITHSGSLSAFFDNLVSSLLVRAVRGKIRGMR